jgi:hypothetical protein
MGGGINSPESNTKQLYQTLLRHIFIGDESYYLRFFLALYRARHLIFKVESRLKFASNICFPFSPFALRNSILKKQVRRS